MNFQQPARDSKPVVVGTPFGIDATSLYVGVGGTVVITKVNGDTESWLVPDAFVIPQRCKGVVSVSGASNMIALFN
ncbi:hypothetical protein [uncultured Paraglaciecola sp.]|uniref:hypothetical protein n=1 Tax=uncultured Paraglaciecola sp. TaxID=1765024 RepID=UPI002631A5A8|nr:hypothetical protein [uncultured Paraglaciecola sp.]